MVVQLVVKCKLVNRHVLGYYLWLTDAMWLVCSVLYISIHRADIFPAGDSSYVNKVGLQQGAGFNINIPWLKVHLFYLPWSCIAGLRLRNDLYCGEWGVKLYSTQPTITFSFIIQYRIVACTTMSALCCANTSVSREADFAPYLYPHVSQDPAKTGRHEFSSSKLCVAALMVASNSLEVVRR